MKKEIKHPSPQSYQEFQAADGAFIENWFKKAKKWKKQGIPLEVALHEVTLEFQARKLGMEAHYGQKIRDVFFDKKEDQAQLEKINNRYGYYIECEKATLSDKLFSRIDKLAARLGILRSKHAEMHTFLPQPKTQDDGSTKTI